MRYVLIVIIAGAAWFGWKKYKGDQAREPAPVNDANKTTGADATNRVDTRSGFVADPP